MANPPLRVVHVIPDFALGGIQKGGCVLAAAMAQRGHEVTVLGGIGGPRFLADTKQPNLTHQIVGRELDTEQTFRSIESIRPDVVHIHLFRFWDGLIHRLASMNPPPLIVSTPVFGRAPDDASLLAGTRTCLVGTYTFYRFCRWLGVPFDRAISQLGIGYVPITPFEPPHDPLSTLDDPALVQSRRQPFGIPPGAFIVGRIGRDDPGKWNPQNTQLVNGLLEKLPEACWLSIGYPQSLGRDALAARWGRRFINLPETADYRRLLEVLSSLDVQAFFGWGECFASSIAEAAGVGVPTIAMINPLKDNGQAEQVSDGMNGYLVATAQQAVERLGELWRDPAQLARMKRQTQDHCWTRWHRDRATDDLLTLYTYWRDLSQPRPAYAEFMLRETEDFAARYRPRMVQLLAGQDPIARLKWKSLLAAVENRPLWLAGRAIKRTLRRSPSFDMTDAPPATAKP